MMTRNFEPSCRDRIELTVEPSHVGIECPRKIDSQECCALLEGGAVQLHGGRLRLRVQHYGLPSKLLAHMVAFYHNLQGARIGVI